MRTVYLSLACLSFVATSVTASALDLKIEGKTLDQALKEISAQTGQKLQASGEVKNEVVYINVTNTDLTTVLTQLSRATGLEWVQSGDTYTLDLTPSAKRSLQQETGRYVQAALQKAIDQRYANQTRTAGFDYANELRNNIAAAAARQRSDRVSLNSPIMDSIGWVLTGGDLSFLADLEPNTRVVFSSAPTTRQKRMPARMRAAIDAGARGYTALIKEAIAAAQEGQRAPVSSLRNVQNLQERLNRPIAKANFIVARQANGFGFLLQYVDREGQTIESVSIGTIPIDSSNVEGYAPVSFPRVDATTDVVLRNLAQATIFTDRTVRTMDREVNALFADTPERQTQIPFSSKIDPQAIPVLINPEENDPLGLLVTPFMDKLAESSGNLIAIIPDEAAGRFGAALLKGDTKFLENYGVMTTEQANGWTIVRPTDRLTAIMSRTNRSALKDLFLQMSKNYGLLSIQDLCTYAVKSPRGVPTSAIDYAVANWLFESESAREVARTKEEGWFNYNIIAKLSGDTFPTSMANQPGLHGAFTDKFYNSGLDPSGNGRQRLDLLSSQVQFLGDGEYSLTLDNSSFQDATFSAASQEVAFVRAIATDVTDLAVQGGQVQFISELNLADGATFEIQAQNQRRNNNGPARPDERTDRRPYGIPEAGKLQGNSNTGTSFLAIDLQTGRKVTYNAGSYANLLVAANYGGNRSFPASAQVFDQYLMIEQQTIVLTLEIEPGYSITAAVSGKRPVNTPTSYANLPQSLQDDVIRQTKRYEEIYRRRLDQDRNRGRGGRDGFDW